LSGAASVIIEKQVRRAGRHLIFGWGEGGFQGWSNSKESLDERITRADGKPMAPWTLHDIRRSVATRMNDLGIAPPHVIEAILNHVSGHKAGVAGIYNRSDYAREKRSALALWADHVRSVVDGDERKVVPLRTPIPGLDDARGLSPRNEGSAVHRPRRSCSFECSTYCAQKF
jgi:hypothetical protein